MRFVWNIGVKGWPTIAFVIGVVMILTCGPLSMLLAIWLSERTPEAKVVFYYPGDHAVWVSPWLYYFSRAMRYLVFAGISLAAGGLMLSVLKRKHGP